MRLVNRLLAALVAVTVIVVGVLVAVEVVAYRLTGEPAVVDWRSWYQWMGRTSWTQGSVRVVCIALAVAGVVLLVAELSRAKPRRLRVPSSAADAAWTRKGVAASVRSAVTEVDGIRAAKVTVTRRAVKVRADSSATETAGARALQDPAEQAARRRLDELELETSPSLSVRVSPRSA